MITNLEKIVGITTGIVGIMVLMISAYLPTFSIWQCWNSMVGFAGIFLLGYYL